MCTWNSNKPYFVRCLRSIRKEVPVHHFILVDRFSNDGTLETVKKVFPNAIVRETDSNLGVARKIGINLVDTDFFIFVDDDIELCDGWFKEIVSYLDESTGAIHGMVPPSLRHLNKWFEWVWKKWLPRRKGTLEKVQVVTIKEPDITRGYTNNTLVRKSVVEDWAPPSFLCAYEDHMMLRHVVKKGYAWKILTQLTVRHWGIDNLRGWMRKAMWNIAGARLIKFDNFSLWSLITAVPKQTLKAIYASIELNEPLIIPYVFFGELARVHGWLNWTKYLTMKR